MNTDSAHGIDGGMFAAAQGEAAPQVAAAAARPRTKAAKAPAGPDEQLALLWTCIDALTEAGKLRRLGGAFARFVATLDGRLLELAHDVHAQVAAQ